MDWKKMKSGSDVRGKAVGEDALIMYCYWTGQQDYGAYASESYGGRRK